MGVKTRVWGPVAWHVLFTLAAVCDHQSSDTREEKWWRFMDVFALMLPCGYCRLSVHRCLAEVHHYAQQCGSPAHRPRFFYSRLAFVLRRMVESKLLCQDLTRLHASKRRGIVWSQELQQDVTQHAWYHIQMRYLQVSVGKHLAPSSRFWSSVVNLGYLIHADLPQCHQQEMHRIPNFALRIYAIRHYFAAVQSLLPHTYHSVLEPFLASLPLVDYVRHRIGEHDSRPMLFSHLYSMESQSKVADPTKTLDDRLAECSAASIPAWHHPS